MHSETEAARVIPLPCNVCKRQARFLTPSGLKCPDHALEAAILTDPQEGEQWLPIRIRKPRGDIGAW